MYTYKYRHDLQEGEDFVYVKGVLAGILEALTSRMPSAKTSRMPYFADLSANQPMITGLNCRK